MPPMRISTLRSGRTSLLLFSEAQYAMRDEWNADPSHRLHLVPERFHTDRPIDWSRGWSLTHDEERQIPAGYAWYGHPDLAHTSTASPTRTAARAATRSKRRSCRGSANSSSATRWPCGGTTGCPGPRFDLDCLHDPYIDTLREFYAAHGPRACGSLDLTTDLGVPTFARSRSRGHPVQDIMVGFGAHLDPRHRGDPGADRGEPVPAVRRST